MFFTRRFFVVLAVVFILYLASYAFPVCYEAARWLGCILLYLSAIDGSLGLGLRFRKGGLGVYLLFVLYNLSFGYLVHRLTTLPITIVLVIGTLIGLILLWPSTNRSETITARRSCSDRFSNGDENEVRITVENRLSIPVHVDIIDELPDIFQRRDVRFPVELKRGEKREIVYRLRPVRRGVYHFGRIRLFVTSPLGLVTTRVTDGDPQEVKVYPSYLMLNQYELLAAHHNLTELGIKRVRRLGHHTEFEHIKEYVRGDD